MEYLALLCVLIEAFGSRTFSAKLLSHLLRHDSRWEKRIKQLQPSLSYSGQGYEKAITVKALSNDLKRMCLGMGFLKRAKGDRWIISNNKVHVRGYEYLYSLTKQGLSYYAYRTSDKVRQTFDAMNLNDPIFQLLLKEIPEQSRAPLIELYRVANPSTASAQKRFHRRDSRERLWEAVFFAAKLNNGLESNSHTTKIFIPKQPQTYFPISSIPVDDFLGHFAADTIVSDNMSMVKYIEELRELAIANRLTPITSDRQSVSSVPPVLNKDNLSSSPVVNENHEQKTLN